MVPIVRGGPRVDAYHNAYHTLKDIHREEGAEAEEEEGGRSPLFSSFSFFFFFALSSLAETAAAISTPAAPPPTTTTQGSEAGGEEEEEEEEEADAASQASKSGRSLSSREWTGFTAIDRFDAFSKSPLAVEPTSRESIS